MRANPTAPVILNIIRLQDPHLFRLIIATKRHTPTIPTAVTIQIARARDNRAPVNIDHAPRDLPLNVQTDAAVRMTGDILAVIVDGGGTDGSALDDGTGAVGEGLVEFVDEVVVRVEAGVV